MKRIPRTSLLSNTNPLRLGSLVNGSALRYLVTNDGPALPPGYTPVSQRAAGDESLLFAAKAPSPKASESNTKSATSASLKPVPSSSNDRLVEGYVREDGMVLRRRGDGESAILEFVEPLAPTKLGQLRNDMVEKAPQTEKELRDIMEKIHIAKDDIHRSLAVKSRADFVEKVDDAQRRKDFVTQEQLPIYDDDGHKTFRRETGRGYRSVDGGKQLLPSERAPGDEDDEVSGHSAASSDASPSSAHTPQQGSATNEADGEFAAQQAAVIDALRSRRKTRSSKLFSNINTIDEADVSAQPKPLPTPPVGGFQRYTRGGGDAPNPLQHEAPTAKAMEDDLTSRYDPLRHMLNQRDQKNKEAKDAAQKNSVWADEVLGVAPKPGYRGDVLSSHEDVKQKESSDGGGGGFVGSLNDHVEFGDSGPARRARAADDDDASLNAAGDVKISAMGASSKKAFDARQYQRDLEALDYFQGTPQHEKMMEDFNRKYNMEGSSPEAQNKFRASYTEADIAAGLEGEPIDIAHSSLKMQQAASSSPMLKFHPGIMASKAGLNNPLQGYAFNPSVELGKLQRDIAIEAARQDAAHLKAKQKDVIERLTTLDPVQRKQMRLILADFDRKDTQTSLHVLHSYPFSDNLSVMLMFILFVSLYKGQHYFDAEDFYQDYLGFDTRALPSMRKWVYIVVAMVITGMMLHPCNLSAIALTRGYRIFMRRPLGPP